MMSAFQRVRIGLGFLLLLSSGLVAAREPVPFVDPFHDGYVLTLWRATYTTKELRAIFDRIQRAGTHQLTIPVFGCQTSLSSADVGGCEVIPYRTTLDIARSAIESGFSVVFLPIVTTPRWEWRGFFEPTNPIAWFRSYTQWMHQLARDAQALGMKELIVGSEFTRLYRFESSWVEVLRSLRQSFSGPLILTVNWGDLDHTFWEEADAIGVSAYYPLSNLENPSQADLDAAWQQRRAEFLSLTQRWHRPLHITEVGYSSSSGTARTPWTYGATDRPDAALQARCFTAFQRAWINERALIRSNIWSATEPGASDFPVNFEVFGKPAEAILAEFFRFRASLR